MFSIVFCKELVQVIVSHGDGISVLCPSSPAAAVGFLTAVVFDCTLKSNFLFFPVLLHILKCNLLPFLSFIAQSFLKVPPQSCPVQKKSIQKSYQQYALHKIIYCSTAATVFAQFPKIISIWTKSSQRTCLLLLIHSAVMK